ncbi:MAG TPA: uL15m family ribosomal protein, partial [Acidobacteriaceae bacterium]
DRISEVLAKAPGTELTIEALTQHGLLRKKNGLVKVLNNGTLSGPVTIHAHKFSKTAQEAIEKAGGKAVLIGGAAA